MNWRTRLLAVHLVQLLFSNALLTGQATAPDGQGVEACAQRLANWRAETRTGDDGPAARTALQALLAEGEQLLRDIPEDAQRIDLLARLWRTELNELARTAATGERLLRLARLGDTALAALANDRAGADEQSERERSFRRAMGQAAARAIAPGELRRSLSNRSAQTTNPYAADGKPTEVLELTVAAALAKGDVAFVNRLGVDAVPALVALTWRPRLLDGASTQPDPLVLLARNSPSDALNVALRLVDERGAIGRARVLSAFAIENPFANAGVWASQAPRARIAQADWATLPKRVLASDPKRARDVDPWIAEFVHRNQAPTGIAELMPGWIARGNQTADPVPEVAIAAAKRLIERGNPDQALAAADVLLRTHDIHSLWSIANPSAALRPALARAFGLRQHRGHKQQADDVLVPIVDDAYASALQSFACSNPDALAITALQNAAQVAHHVGRAVLSRSQLEPCIAMLRGRSATDLPSWIAALAGHAAWLDDRQRNAMFGSIARHLSVSIRSDSEAVERGAVALLRSAREGDGIDGLRAAFDCLLATASASTKPSSDTAIAYTGLAAELAACWQTGSPTAATHELTKQLLENCSANAVRLFAAAPTTPRRDWQARPFLRTLPKDLRILLVRRLCQSEPVASTTFAADDVPLTPSNWLDIAANTPGLQPNGAEWALRRLASADGPRLAPANATELARAMVRAGDCVLNGPAIEALGIPTDDLLRALLAMSSPQADAVLASCSTEIHDPSLLEPLLKRLPPSGWRHANECWLHRFLLRQLAARHDRRLHPSMLAANLPGSTLQLFLIETLEHNRAAVHLPVAGALLRSEHFRSDELRARAVELVASYRNDEAAQFLLQASREWTRPRHRELLKKAFDHLVAWRESEQRWLQGSGAAERRAQAIADFVKQLDGDDIGRRVRALQALAALEATEELPRISELCDASSLEVRSAAKQAFERLLK